jgi:hypothetical protein
MKYFGQFPKVMYSLTPDSSDLQVATDITFPVQILQSFADNSKYYYQTIVKDGLKPEDVAYLVYGDATLHWIVLHFNKIVDPLFQWPLSSVNLDKYVTKKYGSIGIAQSTIQTYYKIITRVSSTSDMAAIQNIEVGAAEYANTIIDFGGNSIQLVDGEVVTTFSDRSVLSAYDYEIQQNEARREINLIQVAYIDSIISSFNSLAATS